MLRHVRLIHALFVALLVAVPLAVNAAEPPSAAQLEFFETRIRPGLIEQCYECHNSAKKAEGGLAVDDRSAIFDYLFQRNAYAALSVVEALV